MAHINVYDFVALGLDMSGHTATSYCVAKDKNFEQIIDSSIKNTQDLYKWTTPLPKRVEDGGEGFYSDLRKVYSRVKLHFGEFESPWWELDIEDQKVQDVVMTEKDKLPVFTTAEKLGWTKDIINTNDDGITYPEEELDTGFTAPFSIEKDK